MITSSVMTRMPRAMRRRDEALDVVDRAVVGMDGAVFGDVVAVVEARRRIEGQQPERVDAELGDVVELGDQAGEVADAVIVGIEERLDVQLVDDRVLVPERIVRNVAAERCVPAGRSWPRLRSARCARSRTAGRPDRAARAAACPVQTKRLPRIRSSTSSEPWSGSFHSHSGSSKVASCTLCGSRLTATRIMSAPSGDALAVDQDLVVEGVVEASRRDGYAAPDAPCAGG